MQKLYMLLIGCSPAGRHIEQHDVFFGIGENIRDVFPDLLAFWPEAKKTLHLDAWREVNYVNGYSVKVIDEPGVQSEMHLFFINLGGYKQQEFEEFHYKMIIPAPDKGVAVALSKQTAFFKHTGFKGANAHIDDKYGIDVDDIYAIHEILPASVKNKFSLVIEKATNNDREDEVHLGYFKLDNVDKWAPL